MTDTCKYPEQVKGYGEWPFLVTLLPMVGGVPECIRIRDIIWPTVTYNQASA